MQFSQGFSYTCKKSYQGYALHHSIKMSAVHGSIHKALPLYQIDVLLNFLHMNPKGWCTHEVCSHSNVFGNSLLSDNALQHKCKNVEMPLREGFAIFEWSASFKISILISLVFALPF